MAEHHASVPGPAVARVSSIADIASALDAVAVPCRRPVLVLVGGAAGMDEAGLDALEHVLRRAVLPVLAESGSVVIDGGTDAGVMRAIGRARAAMAGRFPLVGVAAEGTVVLPGAPPSGRDAAEIEAHHTHLLLVPGITWGDESPWLAAVADIAADGQPSVTLLVNGGEIAFDDVAASLARGRPVVVLAGTGRTADAIAEAAAGRNRIPRAVPIAESPLTQIIPFENINAVRSAVKKALS